MIFWLKRNQSLTDPTLDAGIETTMYLCLERSSPSVNEVNPDAGIETGVDVGRAGVNVGVNEVNPDAGIETVERRPGQFIALMRE